MATENTAMWYRKVSRLLASDRYYTYEVPRRIMPHTGRLWDRVNRTGFGFAAGYILLVVAVYALTAAIGRPSDVVLQCVLWIPSLLMMPWSLLTERLIDPDVPWSQTVSLIAFLAGMAVNTAAMYIIGSKIQAVRRSLLLAALTLLASAVAWWPFFALHGPVWFPIALVVLCMCLSMALVPPSWPLLTLACGIGTFGGIVFGSVQWPLDDSIAGAYVPIFAVVAAFLIMLIGCLAGVILSESISTVRANSARMNGVK